MPLKRFYKDTSSVIISEGELLDGPQLDGEAEKRELKCLKKYFGKEAGRAQGFTRLKAAVEILHLQFPYP
jgi:hypothetical protein